MTQISQSFYSEINSCLTIDRQSVIHPLQALDLHYRLTLDLLNFLLSRDDISLFDCLCYRSSCLKFHDDIELSITHSHAAKKSLNAHPDSAQGDLFNGW